MMIVALSFIPLVGWCCLLFGRGWFWLCRERDDAAALAIEGQPKEPPAWPDVVAIVPARDEEELIAQSVGSLLRQDYPGRFSLIVVDDQSADGTSSAALSAGRASGSGRSVRIVAGREAPAGWTGKP